MAYTTAAKVRALLPTLLMNDDDLGISYSGTNLVLTYPAFDVPTILKDGVSITAYTFERPDKITLNSAATGERYIAQTYIGISDADIEAIITSIDRDILAEFTNYDLPAAGYLEDWSGIGTVIKYLRLYATASEENMARADALEKALKEKMDSFKVDVSGDSSHIIVKVNA